MYRLIVCVDAAAVHFGGRVFERFGEAQRCVAEAVRTCATGGFVRGIELQRGTAFPQPPACSCRRRSHSAAPLRLWRTVRRWGPEVAERILQQTALNPVVRPPERVAAANLDLTLHEIAVDAPREAWITERADAAIVTMEVDLWGAPPEPSAERDSAPCSTASARTTGERDRAAYRSSRGQLAAAGVFMVVAIVALFLLQTRGKPFEMLEALETDVPAVVQQVPLNGRTLLQVGQAGR